jgi:ubiquinone/menaquinone biosynthesis C-methylase UbiE
MDEDTEARKMREKHFHDHAFEEETRAPLRKYYMVVAKSRRHYTKSLTGNCRGKAVLEYGCGTGSAAFRLAQAGANVIGIDISPVAIEKAQKTAEDLRLADHLQFLTMDAEHLSFGDDSFDLICGTGVLHHLELEQAYAEIARVLKPTGKAVFSEPLGHNLIINLYRKLTPRFRTVDEHPLMKRDIQLAGKFFERVHVRYYHLAALAAVPFRRQRYFGKLLTALDALDTLLFTLPGMRRQAWMSEMVLSGPRS